MNPTDYPSASAYAEALAKKEVDDMLGQCSSLSCYYRIREAKQDGFALGLLTAAAFFCLPWIIAWMFL